MEKGRYIAALIISGIVLVVGISLSCSLSSDKILFSILSYLAASVIGNLIWFDGPVVAVGAGGFGLVATVWAWFISLWESGAGIFLIFIFGGPILSVVLGITGITIIIIAFLSMILYPINIIKYGFSLE